MELQSDLLPAFAPLKLAFDRGTLLRCIKSNYEILQQRTVVYENGHSEFYENGGQLEAVLDDKRLREAQFYKKSPTGEIQIVNNPLTTYRVGNLTWVPGVPATETDISFFKNGVKTLFIHEYKQPWQWRENAHATELRAFLETVGFEYIQMVRIVAMFPPAIGVIHRDSGPIITDNYYREGFSSLTLNLAEGGGKLYFERHGKIFCCEGDIWHFNDAYPHGVSEVTSERIQVRVWGKIPTEKYLSMMDLSRQVQ